MPEAQSLDVTLPASIQSGPRGSHEGGLSKKERLILSLQLKGFRQREIAQMLGLNEANVSLLVNRSHYLEAFDRQLGAVDQEFLRLKPLAYRALQNGLVSDETTVGLRAAELWFKSMGYRGFGAGEDGNIRLTAEDIATKLLAAGGGSVVIEVSRTDSEATQGQGISPEDASEA